MRRVIVALWAVSLRFCFHFWLGTGFGTEVRFAAGWRLTLRRRRAQLRGVGTAPRAVETAVGPLVRRSPSGLALSCNDDMVLERVDCGELFQSRAPAYGFDLDFASGAGGGHVAFSGNLAFLLLREKVGFAPGQFSEWRPANGSSESSSRSANAPSLLKNGGPPAPYRKPPLSAAAPRARFRAQKRYIPTVGVFAVFDGHGARPAAAARAGAAALARFAGPLFRHHYSRVVVPALLKELSRNRDPVTGETHVPLDYYTGTMRAVMQRKVETLFHRLHAEMRAQLGPAGGASLTLVVWDHARTFVAAAGDAPAFYVDRSSRQFVPISEVCTARNPLHNAAAWASIQRVFDQAAPARVVEGNTVRFQWVREKYRWKEYPKPPASGAGTELAAARAAAPRRPDGPVLDPPVRLPTASGGPPGHAQKRRVQIAQTRGVSAAAEAAAKAADVAARAAEAVATAPPETVPKAAAAAAARAAASAAAMAAWAVAAAAPCPGNRATKTRISPVDEKPIETSLETAATALKTAKLSDTAKTPELSATGKIGDAAESEAPHSETLESETAEPETAEPETSESSIPQLQPIQHSDVFAHKQRVAAEVIVPQTLPGVRRRGEFHGTASLSYGLPGGGAAPTAALIGRSALSRAIGAGIEGAVAPTEVNSARFVRSDPVVYVFVAAAAGVREELVLATRGFSRLLDAHVRPRVQKAHVRVTCDAAHAPQPCFETPELEFRRLAAGLCDAEPFPPAALLEKTRRIDDFVDAQARALAFRVFAKVVESGENREAPQSDDLPEVKEPSEAGELPEAEGAVKAVRRDPTPPAIVPPAAAAAAEGDGEIVRRPVLPAAGPLPEDRRGVMQGVYNELRALEGRDAPHSEDLSLLYIRRVDPADGRTMIHELRDWLRAVAPPGLECLEDGRPPLSRRATQPGGHI